MLAEQFLALNQQSLHFSFTLFTINVVFNLTLELAQFSVFTKLCERSLDRGKSVLQLLTALQTTNLFQCITSEALSLVKTLTRHCRLAAAQQALCRRVFLQALID